MTWFTLAQVRCVAAGSSATDAQAERNHLFRRKLRTQHLLREAPASPPVSDSVRDPDKCSCDFCVSTHRLEPTKVSPMKCAPAFTVDISAECSPPKSSLKASEGGVAYTYFCLCYCQPLFKEKNEACIAFNNEELAAVDADGDGNCEDPKLPVQVEQKLYPDPINAAKQAMTETTITKSEEEIQAEIAKWKAMEATQRENIAVAHENLRIASR